MNMKLNENEPEEWLGVDLFLYLLTPGPEWGRHINKYRSALVQVRSYHIRTCVEPKVWKLRCNMQPWLRKLLNPYFIIYN